MPSTHPSTSEQLREARLRIAALEREIEVLRANTTIKNGHNIQDDDINLKLKSNNCIIGTYSDVSRDQSQISCLDVQQSNNNNNNQLKSPELLSPITSPILKSTSITTTILPTPSTSNNSSPLLLENNNNNNKKDKNITIKSSSDVNNNNNFKNRQQQSCSNHNQILLNKNNNNNLSPSSTTTTKKNNSSCSSPLLASTTSKQQQQQQQQQLLKKTTPIIAPTPITCNNNTKNNITSTQQTSNCIKPTIISTNGNEIKNNNNNNSISTNIHLKKQRLSTLSINNKTSNTKKDRSNIVAKCVEPRPGQTRYWTEDEHQRFLEAIAEYGDKAYVAISNYVETRTPKQVRTHAQKFQMKMARLARQSLEAGQPIQMPPGMCPVIEVPMGSKSTIVPITPEQTAKLCSRSTGGTIDPTTIVSTLSSCQSAVRQGYSKKKGISKTSKSQRIKQQQQQQQQNKKQDRLSSINTLRPNESSTMCTIEKKDDKSRKDFDNNNISNRMMIEDEVKSIKDEDITMCAEQSSSDSEQQDVLSKSGLNSKESSGGDESCSSLSDPCDEYITCGAEASDVTNDEMEIETKLKQKLDGATSDDVDNVGVGDTNNETAFLTSEKSVKGSSSTKVEVDDLEDLDKLEDGDLVLAPFANPTENWLLSDSSIESLA